MAVKETISRAAITTAFPAAGGMVMFAGGMGVYFNSLYMAVACLGFCIFLNAMAFATAIIRSVSAKDLDNDDIE